MLKSGINSRLAMILEETKRCAKEVREAGGDQLYHTGDLFHVRGSVAPSVLNATKDAYKEIIDSGISINILAGNHDLEGKRSDRLGSAITALEDIGCKIVNSEMIIESQRVAMIPWIDNVEDLKCDIELMVGHINHLPRAVTRDMHRHSEWTLMIHAPIDGVIAGLPDHGLSDAWIKSKGFARVFSGHYHNHKDMGDGVYSVGALAHHTWSDVGAKAGFLIVTDGGVKWFKSHAPEFIEINADTDPDDIPALVDGNYVRARTNVATQAEVETLKQQLSECGAAGVVVLSQKSTADMPARSSLSTIKAGASIEVSVNDFINAAGFAEKEQLAKLCQSILTKARSEVTE